MVVGFARDQLINWFGSWSKWTCKFQEVKAQLFSCSAAVKQNQVLPWLSSWYIDHFAVSCSPWPPLRGFETTYLLKREVIATDVTLAVARTWFERERYRKQWKVSHFSHTIEHQSSGWMWWEKPLWALSERQPLRLAEDPKPPTKRLTACSGIWRWLDTLSMSGQQQLSPSGCGFHSKVLSTSKWHKVGELIFNPVYYFLLFL